MKRINKNHDKTSKQEKDQEVLTKELRTKKKHEAMPVSSVPSKQPKITSTKKSLKNLSMDKRTNQKLRDLSEIDEDEAFQLQRKRSTETH